MQVTNNLLSLPIEILYKILSKCPMEAIFAAQVTCRALSEIPSKFFWNQYLISAQKGELDSVSTFHFGKLFLKANGVQDTTGLNLIELATRKKHPIALFTAAMFHKAARRFQPEIGLSEEDIYSLLYKAAEQQHPEAQYRYGKWLLKRNQANLGLPYLEQAATNGKISAQREIGLFCRTSKQPYEKTKGKTLLKEAAKNGDAKAFFALAKRQGLKDEDFFCQISDIETVKFYLGVHFAKKFAKKLRKNPPQNMAEVKAFLDKNRPYFAQFSEVCLGMLIQMKQDNKMLSKKENGTVKKLNKAMLRGEKMAYHLGLIYASGILIPRDDEKALSYFDTIRRNKLFEKIPNFGKPLIDIMECFRFMKALRKNLPKDLLNEKLKIRLKAQATMHNDASLDGLSLANSILLSEANSHKKLPKANLNEVKALMAKCDLDSNEELCLNILYWIKQSNNTWQSEEERVQIMQQIRNIKSSKPMSILEKLLRGFEV